MTEFSPENLSAPMGLAGDVPNLYAEGEFNSWHSIKSRLTEFAQLPNAYQLLESVFDIQDHKAARTTLNEWREGVLSHLPKVSVLTDAEMQGSLGGYSSQLNTIFLSHSANSYDFITGQVLLEEYGHYLDSKFNPGGDTEGDEGELFSAVALQKNLSEQTLHRINSEDDATHILLSSGERYCIEASSQVTLYEHAEYKGVSKSFGMASHAYVGNDFNDRATSIVIPSGSGLVAEVFEHANFQGRSTVISYSQMSIGADWLDNNFKVSHLNDQTSSLIVRQRRSDEVIFFQHGNFQGLAHSDIVGSKSQVRFNDDYSSIDLPDGVGIEVFEHPSFTGRSQVFTSDASFIGLLNDQVSSYRTFPLASSYRVDRLNSDGNEGHRHTFKIFRTGNTSVAGQVRFSTSSDSATSDVDFSSYSAVRTFAPGQTEDVVYVDSRADNLNEGTERFNATISKVNSADTITTASTFGQIFNVNSASSYRVDRLNSDGNEGHRHTFKIFRTGNTSVAGQVRFSTSSDSATSDVDFSSYSAVRTFAPGQTEDVVYVDSRTDNVNEGTERFNATISTINSADTITTASTFGQIFNVIPPDEPSNAVIAIESMGGRIYQSQRADDKKIYTRSSTNGKDWTAWHEAGGETNVAPALATLNNRLYQGHRGLDDRIYTRSSTDGENWTSWHQAEGTTKSSPSMATLNGRLYQTIRGYDNKIYTRSSTNGTSWSQWRASGDGTTLSSPALASLNGRLYQSHRGYDNKIYTRSSSDGINWNDWKASQGETYSSPSLEAVGGRLYQSHRGADNRIYTRSSTDGINWSSWHQNEGSTNFAPAIAELNGRLFQVHRGTDNKIYTRSSTNGQSWDSWHAQGGLQKVFLGKTNGGVDRHAAFNVIQGPDFVQDKETWFVIHGWNGEAANFGDLASAIEEYDGIKNGGDIQVITVDWSGARTGIALTGAASWIDSIGETIKRQVISWGISPSRVNIAGHSLGAYVAYEAAERLGGINKLVAMNPASTTLAGYDTKQVNFSQYSNWSWAFWQNNLTDSGAATLTADESFIISLPWYNPGSSNPDAGHGSAKLVWTNWLRNKNGALSGWFGLEDIKFRTAPWNIGWGWEAEIEANSSFVATGKYWEA
jgi:pimeloyl-ACP methyl ester carboxylesterase